MPGFGVGALGAGHWQMDLVGTGYGGPPVDLDKTRASGLALDERQLRMLKAQVRAKRADFLEVVDRAVASREDQLLSFAQAATIDSETCSGSDLEHPTPAGAESAAGGYACQAMGQDWDGLGACELGFVSMAYMPCKE